MDLTLPSAAIAPMSPAAIANVREIERTALACEQVPIHTHHVLHAGIYSRTIFIPAGIVLTGALVKIPTLLTICGQVAVLCGEQQALHISGFAVIPASAGRKQAFVTKDDTWVSMAFPTAATSIEQAEAEFTDDAELLFSRRDPAFNTVTITGE